VSTKSRGHSCYCRKSGRLLLLHQETGSQAKNDLPTLNDDIILVPCVKPRVSPSDLQSDHKCFQTGRAYTRLLRVVCHCQKRRKNNPWSEDMVLRRLKLGTSFAVQIWTFRTLWTPRPPFPASSGLAHRTYMYICIY